MAMQNDPPKPKETEWAVTINKQLDLFDKPSDRQVGGDYYKTLAIQPSYFAWKNELRGLEFNVVKRVCRYRRGGKGLQDIQKAIHELELIAEWEYGDDKK